MPLLWTDDHERKYQRLYIKHKGTPLEKVVNNLALSKACIYNVSEYQFWKVLKEKSIRDTRLKQKRARLRRYVRGLMDTFGHSLYDLTSCYLVTLTFNDDSLALLSYDTRKRYVREYLQSVCLDYIACIDFGKKTGREHYHAICAFNFNSITPRLNEKNGKWYPQIKEDWRYGFHSLKKIDTSKRSLYKSCSYTFKASEYAFKSAGSLYTPFHARGVAHSRLIIDDYELELFVSTLETHSSNRLSSGFEVARSSYESPYVWFGDSLTYSERNERA